MGQVASKCGIPWQEKRQAILFSLFLLYRSNIAALLRALRGNSLAAAFPASTQLAATALLLSSPSSLWASIRAATGLSKSAQSGLVMALLQLVGFLPDFGTIYAVSLNVFSWVHKNWHWLHVIQFVSTILFHIFNEAPETFPGTYYSFVKKISGPPLPMLAANSAEVLASRPRGGLAFALEPSANWPHFKQSFFYLLRVFLVVSFVFRPLFKALRPKPHAASKDHDNKQNGTANAAAKPPTPVRTRSLSSLELEPSAIARFLFDGVFSAARTATIIALCSQLAFICNRWRVSDNTFVNVVIVRTLFPYIGACLSLLDDAEAIKPIGVYMLANCIGACLNLLGKFTGAQPTHPMRLFGFAHPVLSALGVFSPSLLCGAVLKAL